MWSEFLVDGVLDSFWGPRGIAVDSQNRVYVTDTGKQRVVVFDNLGNYITQFGSRGMVVGQLDEPVGIAVDAEGKVYVADTWNNRVQVFSPNEDGTIFTSVLTWDVDAWTTDSLDNKPFLALGPDNQVSLPTPTWSGHPLQQPGRVPAALGRIPEQLPDGHRERRRGLAGWQCLGQRCAEQHAAAVRAACYPITEHGLQKNNPWISWVVFSVSDFYALEVALLTTCEKALGSRTARSAKTLRFRMISEVRSALIRRV